jgi:hypothetical protein
MIPSFPNAAGLHLGKDRSPGNGAVSRLLCAPRIDSNHSGIHSGLTKTG